MKIKDKITACKMTSLLWHEITIGSGDKEDICKNLFGRVQHSCPCCEYAFQKSTDKENKSSITGVNCDKCPMYGFWSSKKVISKFTCCNEDSPYQQWEDSDDDEDERTALALEVALLADAAVEYWTAMKEMNITW